MVDTVIVETSGFGIFKDKERLALLRRLAEKRGLIVLTDPDGAGFVIRSHLRGSIPPEQVKHAYVPDVYGKERRKRQGGKEGKLRWRVCAQVAGGGVAPCRGHLPGWTGGRPQTPGHHQGRSDGADFNQ
ncbi:MAG: toprim domain-containing protein [Flavonifractor plautii]